MKLEERFETLKKVKSQLNNKFMKKLDFDGVKEMMLWLAQSEDYAKVKTKDTQLGYLDWACKTWLIEKKRFEKIGLDNDIFVGVCSLDDLEYKYHQMEFAIGRMEFDMPEEYIEQAIQMLVESNASGIVMFSILLRETKHREENIVRLAQRLKQYNQFVMAYTLLLEAMESENYNTKKDICLEMADCWISSGQMRQAYETVAKIENPDQQVNGLLKELEAVI